MRKHDNLNKRFSHRHRSASRLAAIQIIYQSLITRQSTLTFGPEFLEHYLDDLLITLKLDSLDREHLDTLYLEAESEADLFDKTISSSLAEGWTIDRLSRIELAILRCGVSELFKMPNIPAKAIISEYTLLSDVCGADVGFVNAVLDRLAKIRRGNEMKQN